MEFEEFFNRSSEFDQLIIELKHAARASVKKEFQDELEALRKENAELREFKLDKQHPENKLKAEIVSKAEFSKRFKATLTAIVESVDFIEIGMLISDAEEIASEEAKTDEEYTTRIHAIRGAISQFINNTKDWKVAPTTLNSTEWITCECCSGKGEFMQQDHIFGGDDYPVWCRTCNGSGKIEKAYMDWLMGKDQKADK